jgi:hypothetical protein
MIQIFNQTYFFILKYNSNLHTLSTNQVCRQKQNRKNIKRLFFVIFLATELKKLVGSGSVIVSKRYGSGTQVCWDVHKC